MWLLNGLTGSREARPRLAAFRLRSGPRPSELLSSASPTSSGSIHRWTPIEAARFHERRSPPSPVSSSSVQRAARPISGTSRATVTAGARSRARGPISPLSRPSRRFRGLPRVTAMWADLCRRLRGDSASLRRSSRSSRPASTRPIWPGSPGTGMPAALARLVGGIGRFLTRFCRSTQPSSPGSRMAVGSRSRCQEHAPASSRLFRSHPSRRRHMTRGLWHGFRVFGSRVASLPLGGWAPGSLTRRPRRRLRLGRSWLLSFCSSRMARCDSSSPMWRPDSSSRMASFGSSSQIWRLEPSPWRRASGDSHEPEL